MTRTLLSLTLTLKLCVVFAGRVKNYQLYIVVGKVCDTSPWHQVNVLRISSGIMSRNSSKIWYNTAGIFPSDYDRISF
jgi:hypothetical protein